jgi:hypothetical protein
MVKLLSSRFQADMAGDNPTTSSNCSHVDKAELFLIVGEKKRESFTPRVTDSIDLEQLGISWLKPIDR